MIIKKLIDGIVERLKLLKPNKIIFFGSYAYGNPTKDSDIDLFLIKNGLKLDELIIINLRKGYSDVNA